MPAIESTGPLIELDAERIVAGGVCLAREASGRVVLLDGALPGERVRVRLTTQKPTLARGEVVELITRSADRVPPPCPALAEGCGGCDFQHAAHGAQRAAKSGVVADALARIGRLADVPVDAGEFLDPWSHRTTLRCGVDPEGRAGLRRRRSHEVLAIDACPVAHPLIDEVLAVSRFPGADEVTIRVGARTGERLVVVAPTAQGVEVPPDVAVVGADRLGGAHPELGPAVHEVVARHRFRVSAGSFFQSRPDGAEALVRAVGRALGPVQPSRSRVADLYGGVGLFSVALGVQDGVVVERSESSAHDARRNLTGRNVEVVNDTVEGWAARGDSSTTGFDAVVADPTRAGLGAAGVASVAATGAARVALVSCDPASLARDARGLVDAGYEVLSVDLVDLFPQTHHIEAVTTLQRVR